MKKFSLTISLLLIPMLVGLAQNQGVREELQRYIGYEPGSYKYLTLPYDQTMGTNVNTSSQDIGFILLLMAGLIFLANRRRKWWQYGLIVLSLLAYLSVCMYYGKLRVGINGFSDVKNPQLREIIDSWSWNSIDRWVGEAYFYNAQFMGGFYDWTAQIFQKADYISIPLLAILFLASLFYANKTFRERDNSQSVQLAFLAFMSMGFYWIILSAGVIWYGYVVFGLAFLLFAAGYGHLSEQSMWTRGLYLTPVIIAVALNLCFKTANIYVNNSVSSLLIDPSVWLYYSDEVNEEYVLDSYLRNLDDMTRELNEENPDAKVYKVGTGFNLLIDRNNERVFEDNQLSFWRQLQNKYSQQEIIDVLKANGFEYMLVGLKAWTIDKTPEQSLVKKYKTLMRFIDESSDLSLIATDRVLQDKTSQRYVYALAGDQNSQLINYGYYALLKIN